MNLAPFFIIALPVLTVLAVGALGSKTRLGFWPTVFLSLLITPIGGLVTVLIIGPKPPGNARRGSSRD